MIFLNFCAFYFEQRTMGWMSGSYLSYKDLFNSSSVTSIIYLIQLVQR